MCGMQGHNFHSCDKKLCFTVSFIIFKNTIKFRFISYDKFVWVNQNLSQILL